MSDNVHIMPTGLNCDHVLEQAKGIYDVVFIIGYRDDNNDMDVRAGGKATVKDLLFLLESFKHKLLAGDYFEEE